MTARTIAYEAHVDAALLVLAHALYEGTAARWARTFVDPSALAEFPGVVEALAAIAAARPTRPDETMAVRAALPLGSAGRNAFDAAAALPTWLLEAHPLAELGGRLRETAAEAA